MKVLFISRGPLGAPGGAARYYLPAIFSKSGLSAGLVAHPGGSGEEVISEFGVQLFMYPMQNLKKRIKAVRQAVNMFDPDIVHVFHHRGCGLYPYFSRFSDKRIKWVLDIRSPLLKSGTSVHFRRWINKWEAQSYNRICAPHTEASVTVVGKGFDVSVLPVGVEMDAVLKRPSRGRGSLMPISCEERRVKAIYIGSLNSIRRMEDMLYSIRMASQRVPILCDVYGDGNGRAALEEIVQSEGLYEVIRFQGIIPRRTIHQRLADYDIGLAYLGNPLHDPAPPLKTLEYLAAGLPVVATDTVGNRMFVEDGVNGVLAGRDAESFGDGIVRLAQSSGFEAMSAGARESVAAYDWERIVQERLIPLYEELMRETE